MFVEKPLYNRSLVSGPFWGRRGGAPQSGPRLGYTPVPNQDQNGGREQGYPNQVLGQGIPRQHMPRTRYAAGGSPLAVTYEDFLVDYFAMVATYSRFT